MKSAALDRLKPIPSPAAMGSIDLFQTSADGSVVATGWAANPVTKKPGSGLILLVDDRVRIDATPWYGLDRDDVAKAFNSPAMERTGFSGAPLSHAGLTAGSHHLSLGVVAPDGRHFYLLHTNKEFRLP
jgi:hypothetical protein